MKQMTFPAFEESYVRPQDLSLRQTWTYLFLDVSDERLEFLLELTPDSGPSHDGGEVY